MKKLILFLTFIVVIGVCSVQAATVEEYLEEARIFKEQGYNESAIAAYNNALEQDPKNAQALKEFADFMVENKDYAYALLLYRRYLEVQPDDVKTIEMVVDLYNSIDLYGEAINVSLDYLKKHPDDQAFLEKLRDIYKSNGFTREEMVLTKKLLETDPENKEIQQKLLTYFIINGEFKDAAAFLDTHEIADQYPPSFLGYVYTEAEKYDKAIQVYQKLQEENPSDETAEAITKAQLAKENQKISNMPRSYSFYYKELNEISARAPEDDPIRESMDYLQRDVRGVYAGYDFTSGRTLGNRYTNHRGRILFPILSTGTELMAVTRIYRVWNQTNSANYNQTGLEVRQPIARNLDLSGGYHMGTNSSTYFGQLRFSNDDVTVGIRGLKEHEIQTPEAIQQNISYNGIAAFGDWNFWDRLSLFGHYTSYSFSDTNYSNYYDVGLSYRLLQDNRRQWLDVGLYRSGESFRFTTPLYYSPRSANQWNVPVEYNLYWTNQSLLKLSYIPSWGNGTFHVFSAYVDHKFNDNFFIYAEYINGFSRFGRVGPFERTDQGDYEYSIGIKARF